MKDVSDIRVIAPNFKRRLSGVTSTIVRLVPLQARDIAIRATGPGLPKSVPHMSLFRVAFLSRRPARVWHARRNNEMLVGVFLRDVLRKDFRLLFTSASQRQHSAYTKWLITKMNRIVATSGKTAVYLDREATVVLHGIDLEQFTVPKNRVDVRQSLGLDLQGPVVGCYGRIRAQKGTDLFVDAMIALFQSGQSGTAIVMGRATAKHQDFFDDLKKRVAAAGLSERILFMPEVPADQMAQWYEALDLYVAPQRWEGFGLTPIEAMACGVPVVATRVGAFEEIVTPETGALIDIDDRAAMVEHARRFLADETLRIEAGRMARLRVAEYFTLEREASALTAIYKEMLAND